jgi:phenol 2-monooxygenase
MDGEQTDYVWGVVDTTPITDFPDIRNRTAIHSRNGSGMIIPREGDVVRLYLQLDERPSEVLGADGRVDRSKWGPERLLGVAKKVFQPWTIEFPKEVDWWTLYISGCCFVISY